MSRPSTPSAKPSTAAGAAGSSSRSHREDVLQFLDNLDAYDGDNSKAQHVKTGSTSSLTASGATDASSTAAGAAGAGKAGAGGASIAQGEDAQSVLDFLDEIVTSRDRKAPTASAASKRTAVSSATKDGLSRSSSRTTLRDGTTGVRKSTESARGSYLTPANPPSAAARSTAAQAQGSSTAAQAAEKLQEAPVPQDVGQAADSAPAAGGWGWGSVWSQATNVIQQARTVAEEQVSKNLPKNIPTSISSLQSQLPVSPSSASASASQAASAATEQAQKWRSGMLNMLSSHVDIDKLRRDITETGLKAMNEIINAVAPPISEHEVIQVNLSHDMLGYEGVETLVYRALAKVMEQVDGGDLVVNRGNAEDQPVAGSGGVNADGEEERNLNSVEGFTEAYKLAEANLEALIKKNYRKPESSGSAEQADGGKGHARTVSSGVTVPVTICPVFMRIQPVLAPLPFSSGAQATPAGTPGAAAGASTQTASSDDPHLYFILLLRDPTNELVHKSLTQSMPSKWLDIPFEENEWVEDIMVDVIRRGVEIVGEEYVKGRMHGRLLKNAPQAETLFEEHEEEGKDAGGDEKAEGSQ